MADGIDRDRTTDGMPGDEVVDRRVGLDRRATAGDRRVYLHLIHRGYDEAARVRVDGSAVPPKGQVTLRLLHGKPPDGEPPLVWQTLQRIDPEAGAIDLLLPPRTVAVASWPVGAGVIGRADVPSDADGS